MRLRKKVWVQPKVSNLPPLPHPQNLQVVKPFLPTTCSICKVNSRVLWSHSEFPALTICHARESLFDLHKPHWELQRLQKIHLAHRVEGSREAIEQVKLKESRFREKHLITSENYRCWQKGAGTERKRHTFHDTKRGNESAGEGDDKTAKQTEKQLKSKHNI